MRFLFMLLVAQFSHAQLVINELMIDPNPIVNLFDEEYVELYNYSEDSVQASNYYLADLTRKVRLPNYIIPPKSYVLCVGNTSSYFGQQVIRLSPWPSLNNASDDIRLYKHEQVIDSVFYTDKWYGIATEGGISLERIAVVSHCDVRSNWAASININGGTPGEINSLAGKVFESKIQHHFLENNVLHLTLNHSLLNTSFICSLNGQEKQTSASQNQLVLNDINESGEVRLQLSNLLNCYDQHNAIDTLIFLSKAPQKGEITLNELLFDPVVGGYDYVEIANNTAEYLDLSQLKITNLRDEISLQGHLPPYGLRAYTQNVYHTVSQYPLSQRETIQEVSRLPAFRSDSGTVVLLKNDTAIDIFKYNKNKHHPLLNNVKGVALERINAKSNHWYSAGSMHNYGTPGYKNSQQIEQIQGIAFDVSPSVFTPDGDGLDDFAIIRYNLDKPGYVGSVFVFDLHGTKVKTLASKQLLDGSGEFIWDGISDLGNRASIGYYIVLFELDMLEQGYKKMKKTVVLGTLF